MLEGANVAVQAGEQNQAVVREAEPEVETLLPRLLMLLALLILSVIAAATVCLLVPLLTGESSLVYSLDQHACVFSHLRCKPLEIAGVSSTGDATGRRLLTAMSIPLRHDMYVIAAGCYTLWATCKGLTWLCRVGQSHDMAGMISSHNFLLPAY